MKRQTIKTRCDQLEIIDPRITDLEFTGDSEEIKAGQWVETRVEFRLDGIPHVGWVQHVPMDSSQNAGVIESIEQAEVEAIEAAAVDAAADQAGEELAADAKAEGAPREI